MRPFFLHFAVPLAILLLALHANADAPTKLTACSAAINTDAEFKVFKEHLDPKQFDFVELTSLGTPAGHPSGAVTDWFDRACSSGVQCDVLVVSAHFSSTGFFSDKSNPSPFRYPLRTDKLIEKTCHSSCDGILKHPTETFLMSCNTLSSKKLDHRTPEMYLQILKKDGALRWKAERAVEDRYGTLGPTNRSQIEYAFGGIPMLYGFRSTSQLSENNVKYLEKYFASPTNADYAQHLQKMSAEQILGSIDRLQTMNRSNATLISAFAGTSICSSSKEFSTNPEQAQFWANVCSLRNPDSPLADRMKLASQLMQSPRKAEYTPDVEALLEQNADPTVPLPPEISGALAPAMNDASTKTFVLNQIKEKAAYPTIRKRLVQFAKTLHYIDQPTYEAMMLDIQNQLQKDDGWQNDDW